MDTSCHIYKVRVCSHSPLQCQTCALMTGSCCRRYSYPFFIIIIIIIIPRGLSTPQECSCRAVTVGDRGQGLGQLVRPGLKPATPSTEKRADVFFCLQLYVLRLESCQLNWMVAGSPTAIDWFQMVPVWPPNPI